MWNILKLLKGTREKLNLSPEVHCAISVILHIDFSQAGRNCSINTSGYNDIEWGFCKFVTLILKDSLKLFSKELYPVKSILSVRIKHEW